MKYEEKKKKKKKRVRGGKKNVGMVFVTTKKGG